MGVFGTEETFGTVVISLLSPANDFKTNSQEVFFNATITPVSRNLTSVNWSGGGQEDFQTFNTDETITLNWTKTFSEGSYSWNVTACWVEETTITNCTTSATRSFEVDLTTPTITMNYPIGTIDYAYNNMTLELNFTATDINLDSVWYDYNGTNVTISSPVSGTPILSNITLLQNNKNITIYANDSSNNLNSTTFSWDYRLFLVSEYYVSSTTAGNINPFNITLESNAQITIAYLNYNNTNYLGSISSSGNTYTMSINQIAHGVSSPTNISFFWNLTRADGFNYATSLRNQTVSPIIINATCGSGMYVIKNFTLVDEITQETLANQTIYDTSIKVDFRFYTSDRSLLIGNYFNEFNRTNPVAFCIDNNLSGGEIYSADLQIQYKATNYSSELYHIEDYVLKAETLYDNITLYNLHNDNAQKFKLIARDSAYIPIQNALIQIERKYIDEGVFKITEIPKTDAKGITSASLQINDVVYNFYVYDNGELVSSFENVLAICQTPLVKECEIELNAFGTGITTPDFDDDADFNFTLDYNSTSRIIISEFNIPTGVPAEIRLVVTRQDILGTAVCEDTLTSASGTVSCIIPSSFGNSTVIAKLYKNNIEYGRGTIKLDQSSKDIFGGILVILSVLVMMTLIGIAISDNPVITGVFLFVGVIILFAMNLVENKGFIGATATILFLGIAIILVLIKAARRT